MLSYGGGIKLPIAVQNWLYLMAPMIVVSFNWISMAANICHLKILPLMMTID